MANYLYPGQAANVWIEELGRYVDVYDTVEEVPESYADDYVGVFQDYSGSLDQQIYARAVTPPSGDARYPGVGPLVVLILVAVIVVAIAAAVITVVQAWLASSSSSTPDPYPVTCSDGRTCYNTKERLGECWYRYNCCDGSLTKLDCADNNGLTDMLITLLVIGAGAYIGFKIVLPALMKKKEE